MPVKRSVALAVTQGRDLSRVLLVQRPEDDEEFPGIWGLPAGTCGPGESLRAAARKIGNLKLGGGLKLGQRLGFGKQDRNGYALEMTLYSATLDCAVTDTESAAATIPSNTASRFRMSSSPSNLS